MYGLPEITGLEVTETEPPCRWACATPAAASTKPTTKPAAQVHLLKLIIEATYRLLRPVPVRDTWCYQPARQKIVQSSSGTVNPRVGRELHSRSRSVSDN